MSLGPNFTLTAPAICAVSGVQLVEGDEVRRDPAERIYSTTVLRVWDFRSAAEGVFHSPFQRGLTADQVQAAMTAGWEVLTVDERHKLCGAYALVSGSVMLLRPGLLASGPAFSEWWERVGSQCIAFMARQRRAS
jgi:hypothetical protein